MSRPSSLPSQPESMDSGTAGVREEAEGELASSTAAAPDNYLERIAKYVPVEVLAFSVFINGIPAQAVRDAGILAGPFFVWYIHNEGDAWVTNAIVCFFAFPCWAYARGAVSFAGYLRG